MAARRVHKPSSSSTSRCTYHVFLSFRGKDTRKNFTDHLYDALKQAGFHTFRDDDEIKRGEDIELEIQKAIRESKISIIVFSKDYASSRWCLDEVVMIMNHRRTDGHFVLPVFYDVDPSQVSDQTQSYADAFAVHEELFKEEMHRVNGWRAALREVADLGGMVLRDGYETTFIKDIVKEVQNKTNRRPLHVSSHLIGVDSLLKKINLWLQEGSTGAEIAIIHGIGGVGKTTIAKTVYNQNFDKFEAVSFLANVRETSEQPGGLVCLQRQLLSDILKKKADRIHYVDEGIIRIKDAICCRRVLIVLDDVDQVEHFNAVIGMQDWLHQGSRVIVTTRRKSLFNVQEAFVKFEVEPLNDNESLQLFCWHAFGRTHLVECYIERSMRVVHYCCGLPLALEVLGSSLSRNPDLWEIALEEPEAIDDYCKIQKILKTSYDSLQDDRDKNLFLDIACFFIGKDKDLLEKIVKDCQLYRKSGIQNLIDHCLMTVDEQNKLMMHQMLRDMGREIVRQESPDDLGQRSRLWHHKDVLTILKDNSGTDKVRSLMLDTYSLVEDKCNGTIVSGRNINPCSNETSAENSLLYNEGNCRSGRHLGFISWKKVQTGKKNSFPLPGKIIMKTGAFTMMSNLKFLQLNDVKLKGSYENFPKRLIWLCWHACPLKLIPKDFCLEELIVLDLCNSKLISVWEGKKSLQLLKILDLSHSLNLVRSPDFSQVTRLEQLVLEGCINLVELHESIGDLEGLVFLNLRDCSSLRKLPNKVCMMESLKTIILSGCFNLQSTTMTQPSTSRPFLRKSITFSLSILPRFLVNLNLDNCNISDDAFLNGLTGLPLLETLNLSGNPITCLPECIKGLTMLNFLILDNCERLLSLPELPGHLGVFLHNCNSLQRISNLPSSLIVDTCDKLVEFQEWIRLELLRNINCIEMIFSMLTLLADTAMKSTCIEMAVYEDYLSIVFQGSEVPSWFSHQIVSFSFSYDVPLLIGHKPCGLYLCFVFSQTSSSTQHVEELAADITIETKGLTFQILGITIQNRQCYGDMTWFSYWNSMALEAGDKVKVTATSYSDHGSKLEVERCGFHPIYEKEEIDTKSSNEEISQNSPLLEQSVSDEDFSNEEISQNSPFLEQSVSDEDFSADEGDEVFPIDVGDIVSSFLSNYSCSQRVTHWMRASRYYKFERIQHVNLLDEGI